VLARPLGGRDAGSDSLDALSISDRGAPVFLDYQTHAAMLAEKKGIWRFILKCETEFVSLLEI
jgi:hypothetical protein